ncbi:hypothetical protein KY290_025034 [Solanum tuberosum]|uniref:Uncharacterized protein n=1 Tax=Solanum tuberosum TaxID=4113 RepID=A0ABQ7UU82_SOLTU|nr:hypothetical protein KY284_023888 [Solanum tuberosum]KAH0754764.1 hypothetical protein KY290_025034 [Solanum tuberosum]
MCRSSSIRPPKSSIKVRNHTQEIWYEGLSLICQACGRIGHTRLQFNTNHNKLVGTTGYTPPKSNTNIICKLSNLFEVLASTSNDLASSDQIIDHPPSSPPLFPRTVTSPPRSNQSTNSAEVSPRHTASSLTTPLLDNNPFSILSPNNLTSTCLNQNTLPSCKNSINHPATCNTQVDNIHLLPRHLFHVSSQMDAEEYMDEEQHINYRTGSPGASNLLYPGSGRKGSVDNPPEFELSCSNDYGGNASLHGQLYESSVVEQPPKSPSPCDDFICFSPHATVVEPPNPFQPTLSLCKGRSPVLHSSETEFGKPSLQPLGTDIQSNEGCNTRGRTGGNNSLVHRNNKLKRSRPYAISGDGRQNVHYKCPPNLKKCSIDFRPPSLRKQPSAHNESFMRNLKDIIRTHNPYILALLETRLQDHSTLKEDLNFNGMLQVPTVGRVGGTVLLWYDNLVVVNQVRNSNQELHVMV